MQRNRGSSKYDPKCHPELANTSQVPDALNADVEPDSVRMRFVNILACWRTQELHEIIACPE
jgi:hypothetical protein